eukprot:CAMPEP_0176184524 /NCGR_PEP_ID=MMETSP0121_2-20121125/861_1 /TAXON_ID=160619 /ORGANISM="Kryptoperidinium foliaceum, Strain CCMP 1326" /LENGTH=38 /DNA_ID= /DNA_START= /DNA_END= /DNA_ORIENTATION=
MTLGGGALEEFGAEGRTSPQIVRRSHAEAQLVTIASGR